jgi:hypothetical protein
MAVDGGSSSRLAELVLPLADIIKRRNDDAEDVRDGAMIELQ